MGEEDRGIVMAACSSLINQTLYKLLAKEALTVLGWIRSRKREISALFVFGCLCVYIYALAFLSERVQMCSYVYLISLQGSLNLELL